MSGSFQNIGGTRTTGREKDYLRNIFITQTSNSASTLITASNPYPNTVRVQYPVPQTFKDCEVAIASLISGIVGKLHITPIPQYSPCSFLDKLLSKGNSSCCGILFLDCDRYNIQSSFGNNVFSYVWPTGSGNQTFTVTIQDGFYTFDYLNQYLEQAMVANGTYLLDAEDNPVYDLSLAANNSAYRVTIFANPVPSSLPSGYSLPSNYPLAGLPGSATDPSLIVPVTQYGCRLIYSWAI